MRTVAPVFPGEMLDEEFLKPLGLTKYRLAKDIGVPAQRIGDIDAGKRAITADTDLRLCRYARARSAELLNRSTEMKPSKAPMFSSCTLSILRRCASPPSRFGRRGMVRCCWIAAQRRKTHATWVANASSETIKRIN